MSANECKYSLDENTQKFVKEVLNETEETREKCIKEIQQWLLENPKINARSDPGSILTFLRCCKFNVERTKSRIKNYYLMRSEIPEWFASRNPDLPDIQELIKLGIFLPLKKTHENRLVVIIRTAAHDPKRHDQNNVFKAGKMLLDIAAKENEFAQIYGVTAVFDMKNVTLGHARQLTPQMIKKAVHAWQNYHCKPKQLEFVNAPLHINVVLNVFKQFMSEKLKNRIRVHFSGLNSLHTIIDKNILPEEYGGCEGKVQEISEFWANKLLTYKDWFQDDEQYKTCT